MSYAIGSSQVRQRHIGITPIKKRYVGENVIWEAGGVPVISSFGVTPNTIDLDTRATGNVSFNVALASTLIEEPTPSTFTFVRDSNGTSLTNSILSGTFSTLIGTRSIGNSNLVRIRFYNYAYTNISFRFRYEFVFLASFVRSNLPLNLIMERSIYPLRSVSFFNVGNIQYANLITTGIIDNHNWVSGGDRPISFTRRTLGYRTFYDSDVGKSYFQAGRGARYFPDTSLSLIFAPSSIRLFNQPSNTYAIRFDGTGYLTTVSKLVVNGNEYGVRLNDTLGSSSRYLYTETISRTADRISTSNTSNSFNIKYKNGTYLFQTDLNKSMNLELTRSFLFNTSSRGVTSDTTARILREPEGTQIGPTLSALRGSPLTGTIPNIPQPTKTTTYRLIARNPAGSSHREVTINVSQNAAISNLRRTGFSQRPDGRRYQFTARVKGYPRPAITWRFSNGTSSQSDNDGIHFTPVSGQTNTWTIIWGTGAGRLYAGNTTDSFTLTATNSSNSVSSTISNIST